MGIEFHNLGVHEEALSPYEENVVVVCFVGSVSVYLNICFIDQ